MDLGTCTAPDKDCEKKAVQKRRKGYRGVHEFPLCDSCYRRLQRSHTLVCSEPCCSARIDPNRNEGRTKPNPWCRLHEHRALQADIIGQDQCDRIRNRLAGNVRPEWTTGCWIWTGRTTKQGYAQYRGGKAIGYWSAHRLSWHLFNEGHTHRFELDHRCATPLCVNPLHLQPVRKTENKALRDLRQKDPNYPWYKDGETDVLPEALMSYASTQVLPMSTPELDYSKDWGIPQQAAIQEQRIETRAREAVINLLGGESAGVQDGQWIKKLNSA